MNQRFNDNIIFPRAFKHDNEYHLDLISMALRGKKFNFGKVIAMVDDMVALLAKQQADERVVKDAATKEHFAALNLLVSRISAVVKCGGGCRKLSSSHGGSEGDSGNAGSFGKDKR